MSEEEEVLLLTLSHLTALVEEGVEAGDLGFSTGSTAPTTSSPYIPPLTSQQKPHLPLGPHLKQTIILSSSSIKLPEAESAGVAGDDE